MNRIYTILILTLLCASATAQEVRRLQPIRSNVGQGLGLTMKAQVPDSMRRMQPTRGHYTFATVYEGDTIPLYVMREVSIYGGEMLLSQKEIRQNQKLIRNCRLMLPYAQEGKRRLDELEIQIAAMPKKDRRKAIKEAEAKLLADYKDELSNYTFSQGLVLIKLIDRETNRTAYNIVGELRGSLRAGLYQTLAKLFGYNLKQTFDPQHDKKDNLIDRICTSIERGQI